MIKYYYEILLFLSVTNHSVKIKLLFSKYYEKHEEYWLKVYHEMTKIVKRLSSNSHKKIVIFIAIAGRKIPGHISAKRKFHSKAQTLHIFQSKTLTAKSYSPPRLSPTYRGAHDSTVIEIGVN